MWDKIRTWAYINKVEINWFLIGFFTALGLVDLGNGNWFGAVINFLLAGANYGFRKI